MDNGAKKIIWINQLLGFRLLFALNKNNQRKKEKRNKKKCFIHVFYSVDSLLILLSRLFCSSALCFTLCLTVCSTPCVKSLLHALGTQPIRGEGKA